MVTKKSGAGQLNKCKYPGLSETLEKIRRAQIDCTLILRSSVVCPKMTEGNTSKKPKTSENNRYNNNNKDKNAAFVECPLQ